MLDSKKKKTFNILTHGCQMNEYDSEVLAGFLRDMGYRQVDDFQQADIFIINTCAIREKAEEKVYSRLGALKKLKEERPSLFIGVCGCVPQQEGLAPGIKSRYPHVDLIFGTHNIHRFPELIKKAMGKRKTLVEVWPEREAIVEGLPVMRKDGIKAWVPITFGCNNYCAYCVVPYVRGREQSRDMRSIVSQAEKLVEEGYKEITLLGQNVNSYGKDLPEKVTFAQLLERLDRVEGLKRIRYMTSHPRDFSRELVEVISKTSKVCEHFHLPLQSGSNKILKKMNRGYSREEYLDLVDYIRQLIPQASITTDIIAGFPGEEEKDFDDTLDMINNVRFDSAFTFIYSPRKGTEAAEMIDQLSPGVKKERLSRLIQAQTRISREINETLRGKVREILVEGVSRDKDSVLTGRTRTNKTVNFLGDKNLVGKLVKVKIREPKTWSLEGELLREPAPF